MIETEQVEMIARKEKDDRERDIEMIEIKIPMIGQIKMIEIN